MSVEELYAAVEQQYEKTLSVFQVATLDSATRNEYKRQVEQYESMYRSLCQMRDMASKADTVASLEEKIVALLTERLEFERYCEKQFS